VLNKIGIFNHDAYQFIIWDFRAGKAEITINLLVLSKQVAGFYAKFINQISKFISA